MKPVHKIGFFAISVLLLGSLIANRMLYHEAVSFYKRLNQVHLQPLGPSAEPVPFTDQPTLMLLGDSRAEQWTFDDEFNHLRVVNRGIGGQTTAQIVRRAEQDLEIVSPDIVVIQAGINDLKTIPLFPDQAEEIIEDCKANLKEIIRLSSKENRFVIVTTVFPVGEPSLYRRPFWSPNVHFGVIEVNEFLKKQTSEGITLLDAYEILSGGNTLINPDYAKDTLHLSTEGYEVLNTELLRILE